MEKMEVFDRKIVDSEVEYYSKMAYEYLAITERARMLYAGVVMCVMDAAFVRDAIVRWMRTVNEDVRVIRTPGREKMTKSWKSKDRRMA